LSRDTKNNIPEQFYFWM